MHAGHLIDALSASLFALLGIWAAVVRRHWFLRFAVVGGVLALALLVPAYEVVIEFGVAMGLIALAVRATRRPRQWRARWSIETVLLAMVVAAVVAAVIGAAPTYGVEMWIRLFGIGFTVSYFGLACLWIVCGRAQVGVRIAGGLAAIALFVVIMYVGEGVLYASSQAFGQPSSSGVFGAALGRWFQADYTLRWIEAIVPGVASGVGITLLVIAAAKASGWFSRTDKGNRRGVQLVARLVLSLLAFAVLVPNTYLLVRLCMPPPLPQARIPADNGYDDFVTAGEIVKKTDLRSVLGINLSSWSDQVLEDYVQRFQPAYDQLAAGLGKSCWATDAYLVGVDGGLSDSQSAIINGAWALQVQLEALDRRDHAQEFADACVQLLQFTHEAMRGQRADSLSVMYSLTTTEGDAIARLAGQVATLTPAHSRRLIPRLEALNRSREPYEAMAERQLAFAYSKWQTHLQDLLADWSGEPRTTDDPWLAKVWRSRISELNLLIADLALQAYWLEHGQSPASLEDLVPEYLAEIPLDALDGWPLRYRREGDAYRVWSVGWNENDDDGAIDDRSGALNGDYLVIGPHMKPLPRDVRMALASAWSGISDWLKAATDEAVRAVLRAAD